MYFVATDDENARDEGTGNNHARALQRKIVEDAANVPGALNRDKERSFTEQSSPETERKRTPNCRR